MSHAGLALVLVGLGAALGAWRQDGGAGGTLRIAFALALAALAFHALELLAP